MSSRFYFPSSGSAPSVTVAPGAEWGHLGATRLLCSLTQGSTALTNFTYVPDAIDHLVDTNSMVAQFISTEELAAQLISAQTVKWQFQCSEINAGNDLFLAVKIYLCGSDGTIKETLLNLQRDGLEMETTNTNRGDSATISSAFAEARDRLVFELGAGGLPVATTGTQGHNVRLRLGESGTNGDLPEDNSSLGTQLNPWLEFANTLDLYVTPSGDPAFSALDDNLVTDLSLADASNTLVSLDEAVTTELTLNDY